MLKLTQIERKATFFRELATMVEAGMSIGEALGALRDRVPPGRLHVAVVEAAASTRRGKPFSEVMRRYSDVFTPVETAMVQAGEQSGRLDRLLGQIATYLEQEYSLRQMISRETFYPKVLFVFVFAFPSVLPALLAYFGPGGSLLKGFVVLLGGLLRLAVLVALAVGLYYFVRYMILSSREMARSVDALKLTVPVFGPVFRRLSLARFSRALAALYGSGVSLPQAVALSADLTGNAALREPLKQAVPQLEAGKGVAEVLAAVPHMDDMALSMLRTGEQTGNIDAMMNRVAEHFEEASSSSIRRMSTLIVPLATIIAGIMVLFIAIGAYTGYFNALLSY